MTDVSYHVLTMPPGDQTQQDRAIALLAEKGMVRFKEFAEAGITAATVSCMRDRGLVYQLGRGLYQHSDAPIDVDLSIAEAAKLAPRGVICLVSALAFHDLTDAIPSRIWMAIGTKDRQPSFRSPPTRFVRFGGKVFGAGIEVHRIGGVAVRVFPRPRLRGYQRETVVAEKFQAMVALGRANTRLKDFPPHACSCPAPFSVILRLARRIAARDHGAGVGHRRATRERSSGQAGG